MLVNPLQQTSLVYDPARQQVTPPPPPVSTPQQNPADVPVQAAATPQDQLNPNGGGGRGGAGGRQESATAAQLRAAWARLEQLREQVREALVSGDAKQAKEMAQEAAAVATTIGDIAGSTPSSGVDSVVYAAQQIEAQGGGSGTSGGGQTPADAGLSPGELPTVIDLARAGLSAAKAVVGTAASIPTHPVGDRVAISGYMQTVLDAMAGIEALAAQASGGGATPAGGSGRIDIRA